MITRQRLAAGLLALLAALTTTLATAPAAFADDPTAGASPAATAPAKVPPKVELILDVSGSMRATDIQGKSRISVAQQAFNDVLDALPSETQLGIRTLGADYPGTDKAQGCLDTKLLYPVGKVDKLEAKTAVATLRPTGFTPIGPALLAAGQDLGSGEGTRRIVLISDGEDTCSPPTPCEVARQLAAQGTNLVVDTLGLALDDKTRDQLTCIATATGGTYTAVTSQSQMSDKLKQLVGRAGDTAVQAPAKVAGTEQCATAPVLAPGVYTDREKFSEHRVYRVPVRGGQERRASGRVARDRAIARDYGVLLMATDAAGQELVRGTDAGSGRTDVLSTGVRWSSGKPAPSASASAAAAAGAAAAPTAEDTVCLVVSNAFAPGAGAALDPGLPLELTVDVVASSPAPSGPILGLGRGWVLLLTLALAGLLFGLLFGWVARWRIAVWRTN